MPPSTLMGILLMGIIRKALLSQRVWIYPVSALLFSSIALPIVSSLIRSSPLLSFLASYPVPYLPFLSLSSAFFAYLIFYYPARSKRRHSMLYVLLAWFFFILIQYILPFLFYIVFPGLCSINPIIQKVVGVLLLSAIILQPCFTSLHLAATGLLLILILSFSSLLFLLPAASVKPLSGLSVLAFLYYFPKMPNFFLSFAPIIRRTIAFSLLFFIILTPQLVTFFQLAASHVLIFLITPQTRKVNFVVRRLHATEYVDYGEATWFIKWLSWSFCALYVICTAAKVYIHLPPTLRF